MHDMSSIRDQPEVDADSAKVSHAIVQSDNHRLIVRTNEEEAKASESDSRNIKLGNHAEWFRDQLEKRDREIEDLKKDS